MKKIGVIVFIIATLCAVSSPARARDNVYKETSVVQRGANAFRIELDTAAVFDIAVTTNFPITVSLWLRYNSSYNIVSGSPTVILYGQGISSTKTVSVGADTWECIVLTGTPTGQGVANLSIRSYSSAAGTKLYFDEMVALSTAADTGTGDFFTDEEEPAKAIYNAETAPRYYTGSGDYFVWDSSVAAAMIFQKYYEPPLMSTGVAAVAISSVSLNWSWCDASSAKKQEDEFRIISSTQGLLSTVAADATYWIETGLAPNTTYFRGVRSWNVVGSSDSAQSAAATLCQERPVDSLTALSGSSIRINFSGGANPADSLYAVKTVVGGATYYVNSANSQLNTSPDYQTLAIWGLPRDVGGLSGNTLYNFSIIARNWGGVNAEGAQNARSTLANKPIAQPFNDNFVSTHSVRCYWDSNGNGAGTTYRVQMSTANDFSVVSATKTTNSGTYLDFDGLAANKGYYFRVCALNLENDPTAFENLTPSNPKYTRIESAVLGAPELAVHFTSATINLSAQNFTNLADGSSGLQFEETGSAGGPWTSNWEKNKIWTRRADNPASSPALTPNTTYQFRARSQNIGAVANDWTAPIVRATKIEPVAGLDFIVGSSSIGVRAQGTFTNLADGQSAVNYTICVNTWQWTNTGVSSGAWTKSGDYYYFTVYSGADDALSPNSTYYLISNSRNYDGVVNSTMTYIAKTTLPTQPRSPAVGYHSAIPLNRLGVQILDESPINPTETEYAVRATTAEAGGAVYWVQADRTLGASAVWRTKSAWNTDLWEAGTDKGVKDLGWNTSYYIRITARNSEGSQTASTDTVKATYARQPYDIALATNAAQQGRLDAYWSPADAAAGYRVQITSSGAAAGDFDVYVSSDSGWLNYSSHSFTGLFINQKYFVRGLARNRTQTSPADWTTDSDKYNYTLTDVPTQVNIKFDVGYASMSVAWAAGANPAGTATKYIVEISSSGSFAWITDSAGSPNGTTFGPPLETQFSGLGKNTKYWARARSTNGDATVGRNYSAWVTAGSSSTLVETPLGINVGAVAQTSANLAVNWNTATDLTDAGGDGSRWTLRKEGDTNVYNSVETASQDANWRDGDAGLTTDIFGATNGALGANTTNFVEVKARNKDKVETPYVGSVFTTRIQPPTGLTFDDVAVTTYSIKVKTAGTFGNLGAIALSTAAVCVTYSNAGSPPDAEETSPLYQDAPPAGTNSNVYWWKNYDTYRTYDFSGGSGNKPYYFKGWSRNRNGVIQTMSGWTTYYTLAEIPGAPALTSTGSTDSIKIVIAPKNNPESSTPYLIAVSTDGSFNPVKYLQNNYALGDALVWRTKPGWEGGDSTCVVKGLAPNAQYFVKIKARNADGVETNFGGANSVWTRQSPVTSHTFDIYQSSIQITAAGDFANLGAGGYGLLFEITDPVAVSSQTAFASWTPAGLSPNVNYTFAVTPYNGAGVSTTTYQTNTATATRIQAASGVEFASVTANIIEARALGTFNNITDAPSGIIVYKTAPAPPEDSGWQGNTNFWGFSGLQPNTTYFFKANSRNRRGLANAETPLVSTVTRANTPAAPTVSIVATDQLNVLINENSNPPSTEFRITASSTNWSTSKYVQSNGTLGDVHAWRSKTDWGADGGINVSGLTPNTQYKFKVAARNSAGTLTADSAEAGRYTKIQSPTGLSYDLYQTSATVTAEGELSNVEQLGWIQFGYTANGQSWTDTSDMNGSGVQTYLWPGLSANTTYYFRVRTKNAMLDAVNDYFVDQTTATRIEHASGVSISEVSESSVSARPTNVGGMSNLAAGNSGWQIKIQEGDADTTYSDWKNTADSVSTGTLKPNREYKFWARGRNRLGLVNGWSVAATTYTYCNVPSSPTVEAVAGFDDRLRVKVTLWAANQNPSSPVNTEYRVEIRRSETGDPPWETGAKYICEIGGIYYVTDYISSATYKTRAGWDGDTGFVVRGLESNKTYAVRLRARNNYGILTAGGTEALCKTLPSKPANVAAVPSTGFETSRALVSWDSNGSQYWVQHATSAFGVWQTVNPPEWTLTANSTTHYDLAPSSQVFYRVKSRNSQLAETDWSDIVSTYTWAAQPGKASLLEPSTYSIKIEWPLSGNPSNVSWWTDVSVDSTNFSGAASSGWVSSTWTVIAGLNDNNKYWARVKAKNPVGIQTAWGNVSNYKYTLIADCTDVVLLSNSVNSIQVRGVPEPANLGAAYDSVGIDFKNLTTGTSSQWIQTNSWTDNTGLAVNTAYEFKVRVKNGDGVAGTAGWQPSVVRNFATAMESPSAVAPLSVSSYNVSAQVSPNSGYTNIASGDSGLVIECHSNPAYTAFVSSTGWSKAENLTGNFGGLVANTTYYFRAKSRNRLNVEAAWSGFGSTVTLCATPTSNTPLDITSGAFTARWGDGGNPGGTRYELWWSTKSVYDVFSSTITQNNDHLLAALAANTTYFTRVRALNRSQTPTDWVDLPVVLTKIEPPPDIEFVDVSTGSIKAKIPGAFTNISLGSSGWILDNLTAGTSSQWQASAPVWWNSAADPSAGSPDSLKASRQYSFKARTRGQTGATNGDISVSTWTKARVPGYDALSQISTAAIRAAWTSNDNVNAQYFVECSSVAGYSVIFATKDWTTQVNYLFGGLGPNTKYYFRAKARNTDVAGTDTGWTNLPSSYTLIEQVAAVAWPSVGVTSITVAAANTVSNVSDTASGVVFKWSDDDFISNVSSTSYLKQTSTAVVSLAPNTTYYFRFITRNGDGVANDETNSWAKSTLANVPGGTTITNPTGNSLTIGIGQNSNSAHTMYAMKAVSGNTTYYVTSAKQLSSNAPDEWWDTAAGWASPFALTNLAGNTPYTISARARNSEGIATAYSVSVTSSTLAATPGKPTPTSLSTSTINLVVNEGTNSAATEFAILVSTDDFSSNLYAQSGGTRAANAVWRTKTQWGGSSGINIADCAPNTRYAFKTQARNGDGIVTDLSIADETYTKIETPTGLAFAVHQTSMDVTATGTFTDLGSGGIQFSFSENNSSWADDAWKTQNQYSKSGLAPNTTYYFRVRTKNGAGAINSFVYTGGMKAARIETVSAAALTFDVGASSLGVRANQTFTNLAAGQSGLWYACYSATSPANVLVSSSAWLPNTSFWYAANLSTNTRYFFEANSRNFDALANSTSAVAAKYTAAAAPPAPNLSNLAAPDGITKIKITAAEGSNPDGTQYAVKVATSESGGDEKWANFTDPDYVAGSSAEWRTKTQWGGGAGFDLTALLANTSYYVTIKSRNGDLAENGFSTAAILATRANVPALSGSGVVALSSSAIQVNWTGAASAYWVEVSSSDSGQWNNLNSGGWIVSVSTKEAGLSPNQRRFYRVKARNHAGLETAWSATTDRYTFVITPSAAATPFDQVGQTAVRAQWSANGNQPGTNYQVRLSTRADFSVVISTVLTTNTSCYWTSGISQNTKYFVDAAGINGDGQPGNPYVVGSTYTYISAPTDLNFVLYQTSVSISCSGVNFGAWSDSTAVRFSEIVKSTDSGWLTQENWFLTGLAPNSTYFVTAETRNGSGIVGGALSKAVTTYIERVEGIEFVVYETSAAARVSPTSYTGISQGQSGVKIWNITKSTETVWTKSPSQWWILDEEVIGVERNQQLVFYADSRNRDGVTAGQTPNISTFTLCETPEISAEVISSGTIKISINRKENSSTNSKFAVEITSAPGYTFVRYVSTSGAAQDTPAWGTYSQFGGAAGKNAVGLESNLEYRFRVKARNGAQIETPYSLSKTTATRIEFPTGINLEVVGSTYIAASPSGSFSRLSNGAAGIQIYSVTPSTDGGWRKDQSAWNFTGTSALTPNTEYTLKARARNIYGDTNPVEVEITTRTRSAVPGPNASVINSSSSITARWTAGGNPFGVNYSAECSSVSVGGLLLSSSGWTTDTEYAFAGLAPNTRYHFRVRAKDDAGNYSDWRVLDSSYTKIEQPAAVSYAYIGQSSVTINASQSLTNLAAGQSGISFEIAEMGDWDQLKSSSNWITQNGFSSAANLAANTTYWARLKVRNGDGLENAYVTSSRATRIEGITQLLFIVDAANNVKVAPAPPNYTSLTEGLAGIQIYETTLSTSSDWRQTTDYWTLAGLAPNQQYTFNAKIRNRASLENALTVSQATWTLSNIAAAPTLTAISTGTLNVIINENSNPSHTQFAVEYSSRSDWTPSYYIDASGQSSATAVWLTKEEWGGVSPGRDLFALSPNRQYRARVYSRNVAGIPRSASPISLKYTLIESPTSFVWTSVGFTSVGLKAAPEPSNLTYGGILFEVDGSNPQSSGWQSGTSANNWTFANLSTNTLLDFSITTKNGDNIPNGAVTFSKATRIEEPVSLATEEITPSSLRLKVKSAKADESFTNLAAGNSGIYFYGVNVSTDSGWLKQTTWTLTGLAPSTKYIFNVKSRNHDAALESAPLAAGPTFYTAPEAVGITHLSTGTPADTAILIKISSGTNGIETEYQVAVSTVNNFAAGTTYYVDANTGNLGTNPDAAWGTHYLWTQDSGGKNIVGLSGNTMYYFKVRAKNPQNVISAFSGVNQQSTNSSAPENLAAAALSSTTLRISWTGVGPKYQVERATWNAPSGAPAQTNGWTRIMDWNVLTSTDDVTLSPNVRRWYRARAGDTGDIGVSNWTASVDNYTRAATPLAGPFANVSSSEIRAAWTANSNPAGTEYKVFVSSLGVGVSTMASYGYTADLASQLFQFLDLNTTYYFWARARNGAGVESSDGVIGSTSTLCAAPAAPTLQATSTHTVRITLNESGNPAATKYSVRISSPGGQQKFLQADGQQGAAAVWRTRAEWEISGSTAAGLLTNTSYFVEAAAANNNGVATAYSAGAAKFTYAAVPSTGAFAVWTTSVTVNFTGGGNPQNTFYQVRCATHSQLTGSVENADGNDISSGTFSSLEPNSRHYFWVRARNGDNVWSEHAEYGARYTRIEQASAMNFTVHWSSIAVAAADSFSRLGEGQSKIIFREYRTAQQSVQTSSTVWTCDTGLLPNATYGFTVQSANGDGLANAESAVTPKATRIENPTGVQFLESATHYVKIAPKNEYSALNVGSSGVEIQRTNSAGTAMLETGGYNNSTAAWTNAGLEPSRIYYYRIRSKNRDGLENDFVAVFSTYTPPTAPTPGSPSIAGRGVDYLEVNWYENNNSTYTYYWVEASSINYGGAPTNDSGWLLNTTFYFLNLIPNTSYYVRVKAKNFINVQSSWTTLDTGWTKIEPVSALAFMTHISSAEVTAVPGGAQFTGAGKGLSGVFVGAYRDEFYTLLHSSKPYDATPSSIFVNLVPNTTYFFTANSRDGAGNQNASTGTLADPISRITKIEPAAGIKFGAITNTSIQAAPDGNFTNVSSTGSGIITYCVTLSSNSGWRNSTSYFTLNSLSPNTLYSFKANSRNRAGTASGETAVISTYTLASSPLASVFTEVTSSTVRASWTAGLPANPENTQYYVEASSVSSSGPYNYHDGWQTNIYRDFDGLSPNTKYYFRVKSRNFANAESSWVDLGSKYTLIETVETANYQVYYTSITITASPQPTNLDEGNSGIIFTNQTTGVNSGWITNITYTFGALAQNTTYQFRVNTKNGEGVSNAAFTLPLSCTLVNAATGMVFNNIAPTSIETKSVGDFPANLGAGLSAIAVEGKNSDLAYSSHTWDASTAWRNFVGLSTNTAYSFRANTRNQLGVNASSSAWVTKYTMAATPGAVSVTTTTQAGALKIISVGPNTNPDYTEFAVAISSSISFATTAYVQPDGTLNAAAAWGTWASGWASNLTMSNLAADVTYYFKAAARNGDSPAAATAFGAVSSKSTRSEIPLISSIVPPAADGNTKLVVSWSGKAYQYKVYCATYSAAAQDRTLLADWSSSTWTSHTPLNPNKRYYYWVKSRNQELVESDFSDEAGEWTLASAPGQISPYYSAVSQDSMRINWTSGNPANPQNTFYKIQRSTAADFSGTLSELNVQATFYHYGGTLAPNRRYYFRISARNDASIPVWTTAAELNLPAAGRATLIENPSGITVSSVTTAGLRITADGEFYNLTNPDAGNNSGIRFKYTDGVSTTTSPSWYQLNYYDATGLAPNTTYTFSAISKNWDNTANDWIPFTSTAATSIESPAAAEFIVTTMTIQSRPVFASGPTNLGAGNSGIKIVRGASTWPDDGFEYIQSTSAWRLWSDLNPNTLYTFQTRTRNRQGVVNDWVTGFSTYTHCVVPSTPTVEDNPQDHTPPVGTHFTRVTVTGGNPVGPGKTNFAVWNINESKWLDGLGGTQASVLWSTSTVWYHYNLAANTTCQYRVKARSNAGIETALSSTGTATTGPGAVAWMSPYERTVVLEGELYRIKWDWDDVGGANYYEMWASTDGVYYEQKAGFTTELTTSYYADHYPDEANKKFWAKARGKQSGTSGYGGWSPSTWTYTQIQRAQLVEFSIVGSTQMALRARSIVNGNPAGFSRIAEGSSGLSYWCSTSAAVGPSVYVSSVSWTQTTNYFTMPAALSPNTTYYFRVQSRNALGETMALSSVADSTATAAAPPARPVLVVATSETVKVAIDPASNPEHTLYSIYFDTPTYRYVDAAGNATSVTPVWRTYSEWGGSGGITVVNLVKSTEYGVKSRAKSVRDILTSWSPTLTAYTLGGQPVIENTSPGTQTPSWTNVSTWKFRATNSDSYRWLWNKISDSSVASDSSAPWDGTTEITANVTSEGSWYFHVGGFSGDPAAKTGQTTYGPVRFDNTSPSLGSVACQKSGTDPTPVVSGEWTRENTPYFYWNAPYAGGENESPIAGYSYSFSQDSGVSPDNTTDTTDTFIEITSPITVGGIWYFKLRAKDSAGNWSQTQTFTYKFNSGEDRPSVVSIAPHGSKINNEWFGVFVSSPIVVTFDRAMDKETSESAVELYAVRDKNGNTIFANVSGAAVYNTQNYQVVFTPSAPLLKNYTYRLVVTVAAKDSMGNNLAAASELYFKTILDEVISNVVVAADEKTKVELESGSVSEPCYIVINIDPASSAILADAAVIKDAVAKTNSSSDKFSRIITASAREFVAYNTSGGNIKTFAAPVTITIPYADADRDGIVDGTTPGIQARMLRIVRLNETTKDWEELETSVDTGKRVVSARTSHFSVYALKGAPNKDVSKSYAYPVPFDTAKGDTTIKFGKAPDSALPSRCRIRIYTITGSPVAALEPAEGAAEFEWNVKNTDALPVSSGVYIYVIDNTEGDRKTGKLMVIR